MNLDGLDPTSPEYAEKWKQAQPKLDAALGAALGDEGLQKFQLEAARQRIAGGNTGN